MKHKSLVWLHFTNVYLGICALLSCIANLSFLQQKHTPILVFVLVAIATIWFYNLAYQKVATSSMLTHRTKWLIQHKKQLITVQSILTASLAIFGLLLLPNVLNFFTYVSTAQQLFLVSFIVIALFYNFRLITKAKFFSLRQIVLLKPFFIAYVWVGLTLVYPFVFNQISANKLVYFDSNFWILFIDGFCYIKLLAILYDVKDVEADAAIGFKTWAVKLANSKLSNLLVLPFSVFFSVIVIVLHQLKYIPPGLAIIMILTYTSIILISLLMKTKKSMIWHLTVIDGVIILKSVAIISLNNMYSS